MLILYTAIAKGLLKEKTEVGEGPLLRTDGEFGRPFGRPRGGKR